MPGNLGFEILIEDDAVLAVAKPSGIATQAPPGIDSLEVRLKRYLAMPDQRSRLGLSGHSTSARPAGLWRDRVCQNAPRRPATLPTIRATDGQENCTGFAWSGSSSRWPAHGLTICKKSTASRGLRSWTTAPGAQEAVLTLPHDRLPPRRILAGNRAARPAARTRFACRPPRAGIRCWAMPITVRN